MATNWTDEQKAAMEPADRLTVLSAAAGSGKTTVLVERALRLLLDEENPVMADRLLIATFSNASAREFKNKIERGISQRIRENPKNNFIKTQKTALQKADISTIHAFCIKLVRENFQELDITADFTLSDEAQSALLHQQAIDLAMNYGYTLPYFKTLVSFYGKSSQDEQIRKFLLEMNYYFSALPHPLKKAEEIREKYDPKIPMEQTPWYSEILKSLASKGDYLAYLSNQMKEVYSNSSFSGYEIGLATVGKLSMGIKEATANFNLEKLKELSAEGPPRLGRATRSCDDSKLINEILYKDYKDVLKEITEELEYLDPAVYTSQMETTKPYIDVLIDVYLYYQNCLSQIKKEKKTYEFSDFEHFALQLLQDKNGQPTPLAQSLRDHYEYIMEDEFQDTSFVQDEIFKMVARENQKNLYVVGDVKQSIYGFRKASPQIFLAKRQIGLTDKTKGNTIFLPHNFRSTPKVIKGINFIFSALMSKEVGGVDYIGEECLKTLKEEEEGPAQVKIEIFEEDEATNVAYKITRMIWNGYLIEENGKKRPVKEGDFCILMRNSKNFSRYKEALEYYGHEAFVKDDEIVLQKKEIQSIISLLRVIANPLQEVFLTATMFGDIFSFSLDEILKIRTTDRNQSLYKALALSKNPKAQNLLSLLKDFTWAADTFSVDKLIDYICKKTDYYSRLAFAEDGGEKRENIRWFTSFAKNYANGYQSSIQGFVRWIDMYLASGRVSDSQVQKPENAVSIMTMHTSKGLEYPVCFVCGLATKFNTMDQSKRLLLDTELGLASYCNSKFGYNNSTLGIQAIKNKMSREMANEELRLLYVAFTRAQNLLVLTAAYNNVFTQNTVSKIVAETGKTVHPVALQRQISPIRWILTALAQHPSLTGQFTYVKEDKEAADYAASCVDLEFSYQPNLRIGEGWEDDEERIFVDLNKAKKRFKFVYPNLAKTKLPIKMSVSEIAKTPPPLVLATPDFIRENKVTGAEKGSAMHRFVQHCDILLARTNFENELLRLEQLGLVDTTLLNIPALKKFVESPVAARILNSQQVFKEKDFLVPYNAGKALNNEEYSQDELLVQGVMDCVLVNDNKVTIIDYKTDFVSSMGQLLEKYTPQLELYRYSAKKLFETQDVGCLLYSFHLNDYVEF